MSPIRRENPGILKVPKSGVAAITRSVRRGRALAATLAYAATTGATKNFRATLAQLLAKQSIRVNTLASGPIWTSLTPSTMPAEKAADFGSNTLLYRPGQSAELAHIYVFFASEQASFITGAVLPVTGGRRCSKRRQVVSW
jgi:NAD(P)-dependent dehydrogenase (short-subunit alcohol dehydrogenase family)